MSDSSFLNCPVCFLKYVSPRILSCGHSICLKCLSKLVVIDPAECPLCRALIGLAWAEAAPINYALQDVVEASTATTSKEAEELCNVHEIPCQIFCKDCQKLQCPSCALLSCCCKHNLCTPEDAIETMRGVATAAITNACTPIRRSLSKQLIWLQTLDDKLTIQMDRLQERLNRLKEWHLKVMTSNLQTCDSSVELVTSATTRMETQVATAGTKSLLSAEWHAELSNQIQKCIIDRTNFQMPEELRRLYAWSYCILQPIGLQQVNYVGSHHTFVSDTQCTLLCVSSHNYGYNWEEQSITVTSVNQKTAEVTTKNLRARFRDLKHLCFCDDANNFYFLNHRSCLVVCGVSTKAQPMVIHEDAVTAVVPVIRNGHDLAGCVVLSEARDELVLLQPKKGQSLWVRINRCSLPYPLAEHNELVYVPSLNAAKCGEFVWSLDSQRVVQCGPTEHLESEGTCNAMRNHLPFKRDLCVHLFESGVLEISHSSGFTIYSKCIVPAHGPREYLLHETDNAIFVERCSTIASKGQRSSQEIILIRPGAMDDTFQECK